MMEENKIKNLVIRFFETLECDITENKGVLKIKNIPQKFEKFYGKTGPYFFYFNESDKNKEGEYITKGSYILSCINKFLENRGETTLLKIKSDKKPIEIIKEKFEIKNCFVSEVYSKSEYKTLERFSFLTTFQYMNKKEEIVTRLFIQNRKKIDIDISGYNLEEGKKREINMDSSNKFKQDYDIAKEKLKEKIQGKIDLLKEQLSRSLEEEKARIQEHYEEQLKDDDKNIEELKKQLDKAKSEKDTEKRDEKRIKIGRAHV